MITCAGMSDMHKDDTLLLELDAVHLPWLDVLVLFQLERKAFVTERKAIVTHSRVIKPGPK